MRSVTFGVAGSWCLPGALGPNWDLAGKPSELPRLLYISLTHCLSHSGFCFSLSPHLLSCGVFKILIYAYFWHTEKKNDVSLTGSDHEEVDRRVGLSTLPSTLITSMW